MFSEIFDRHHRELYRYLRHRVGADLAADLAAETFVTAFGRRGAYRPEGTDARPWLYGIATNLIARRRQAEARFYRAIARTSVDPAAEPVEDTVTARVSAQASRGRLAAALAALSPGDRDVLLLTASGLSYAETARALGLPVGTVSSRLARARTRVREALGGVNPAGTNEENQ